MSAQAGDATVRIAPGAPPPRWQVRVPGSKSLTNRALLLAGVADGESELTGVLRADDTEAMMGALGALGARFDPVAGGLRVTGLGGPPRGTARLDSRMAGTVARFLVPMLAAGRGAWELDGHPQLRRRPLAPVLDALRAQGARIDGEALPLHIDADGLAGGEVEVDASISSQFLSGLLMAAPFARRESVLRFGTLVSAPYVQLTLDAMRAFGVQVARPPREGTLRVMPQPYRATAYAVEPDVSTASYFLASAALTGTTVTLPGLDLDATGQGDVELVEHLRAMGCVVESRAPLTLAGPPRLRGVHVDMNASSDVFMTLACIAPFADGPVTITGIGHARVKESDRIGATAANLRRLGIEVDEGPDRLTVLPGTPRAGVVLPTVEDHRIAMAFALLGARVPVELQDPGVVAKTCPDFFTLWRATGARVDPAPEPPRG